MHRLGLSFAWGREAQVINVGCGLLQERVKFRMVRPRLLRAVSKNVIEWDYGIIQL